MVQGPVARPSRYIQCRALRQLPLLGLLLVALAAVQQGQAAATGSRSFTIENDQFVKDGQPLQLLSGSVHYFRIHPAYWRDRLLRLRSLGLNAIQTYVPWNLHEPHPGDYRFEGSADLERFVRLAQELGLLVLLRPGPYICAEWDFGGFPWWLASSQVRGGQELQLRSNDSAYLAHVDRWWTTLLPRIQPLLYANGGPIVMVQVENEYGFCGDNKAYVRHLAAAARAALGPAALLYTTDPPTLVSKGSLPGDEVYTVVDFGAGWFDLKWAFGQQAAMNPPGKSPPFCSEFYTGWLTHWGEPMANTSAGEMVGVLKDILAFANGTGSVSLYMAHGGTNFGWWAGAGIVNDTVYLPQLTSYDYDAPISEAGATGQPGIGGPNKFQMIRDAIKEHTGVDPPALQPEPAARAYGRVSLAQSAPLLSQMGALYPGAGIPADLPDTMENYNQAHGFTVYRTWLEGGALRQAGSQLDFGAPPHDYAQVLLDGQLVASLERSRPANVSLPGRQKAAPGAQQERQVLDIVVHAMGRDSGGCKFDFKGLQSQQIRLDGKVLEGWRVFPLQLDDVSQLNVSDSLPSVADKVLEVLHGLESSAAATRSLQEQAAAPHRAEPAAAGSAAHAMAAQQGAQLQAAAAEPLGRLTAGRAAVAAARQLPVRADFITSIVTRRRRLAGGASADPAALPGQLASTDASATPAADPSQAGPVFFQGAFNVSGEAVAAGGGQHPADTFLDVSGWAKGVAWVNGFNLGWYWPAQGPQMTLYVPGPLLRAGRNELVLLEVQQAPGTPAVSLVAQPVFSGAKLERLPRRAVLPTAPRAL